jgi:phosphoribosylformylglycinamidine synthase
MKKIGVARFPGTNCDRDAAFMASQLGFQTSYLWHLDLFDHKEFEALIIPGGFSYGDYLRSGALAARSPIISSVAKAAAAGVPILGICNGFQILTEAGLLPGALVRNQGLRFIDTWVNIDLVGHADYWGKKIKKQTLRLPIAHADGRFYAPTDELKKIEDENLVWLRYHGNPNGSLNNIAGVMNKNKNVVGLMPHPERAIADWMGGVDGLGFL